MDKTTVRCTNCDHVWETDWIDLDMPGDCPRCGSDELVEEYP